MDGEKTYFKNLDSIRFIAATMVILGHAFSPAYKYLPIKNTIWERILNTISSGGTGVSIFFVLSGFLISYLLITEHETTSRISIRNFYMRRVLRIWPLYFLVVFFTFLIYPALKSLMGLNAPLCSNYIYYFLFLSNFDVIDIVKTCQGNDAMSQNITWSVSIEEQFYVFWPIIFAFIPKRLWIYAILTTIVGSVVFRLINNNDNVVLYFHTLSVLVDLAIGGLMAYLIKQYRSVRTFFERSSTSIHFILISTSFGLLCWSDLIFTFPYADALARILTAFSFALIISAQAMTKSNSILNLSNIGFAARLGKYTYGIYLLHPIALTFMDVLARTLHIPKTNFLGLFSIGVGTFLFTLLLSKASYKYVELKFLRMKRSYTSTRSVAYELDSQ